MLLSLLLAGTATHFAPQLPGQPWLLHDAWLTLPPSIGRVYPDLEGQEKSLLLATRSGSERRIQRYSLEDGRCIATLWSEPRRAGRNANTSFGRAWSAGGDVDGDGTRDVLVGLHDAENGSGVVLVLSGVDGAELRRHPGS